MSAAAKPPPKSNGKSSDMPFDRGYGMIVSQHHDKISFKFSHLSSTNSFIQGALASLILYKSTINLSLS
jgi:hypothetical protein